MIGICSGTPKVAQVLEKTKRLDALPAQAFHQVERVDQVVLIILGRILHRFADIGEGGEVDHGLNAVVPQAPDRAVRVSLRSPTINRSAGTAARWPMGEIVVNPNIVSARQEQPDGMTADVTGSAGDENSHGDFR